MYKELTYMMETKQQAECFQMTQIFYYEERNKTWMLPWGFCIDSDVKVNWTKVIEIWASRN
jgi:hypothetical protein